MRASSFDQILYRECGFEEVVEQAAGLVIYGFCLKRTKIVHKVYQEAHDLRVKHQFSLSKKITEHERSTSAKVTSDHYDKRRSVYQCRDTSKKRASDNNWEMHKRILLAQNINKDKIQGAIDGRDARAYCHMET